jgi:hypothetical protein
MMRCLSRRLLPRVEQLEDRNLLDASATFSHGVIAILGTPGNDSVVINDGGNLDGATVQVIVNGVQKLLVSGATVRAIRLNTGAGADTVIYNLFGDLDRSSPGGTRLITGTLGSGNDTFRASITSDLNAAVRIAVNGGAGKDSLSTIVTGSLNLSASLSLSLTGGAGNDRITIDSLADVSLGSALSLNMQGGQGNDHMKINVTGLIDGVLNTIQNGGPNEATIAAHISLDLSLTTPPQPMPGCPATCQMVGGQGQNQMSVSFQSQSQAQAQAQANSQTTVIVIGGTQHNTISMTGSNVPITVVP